MYHVPGSKHFPFHKVIINSSLTNTTYRLYQSCKGCISVTKIVYLKMKKKLVLSEKKHVFLHDIAYISTNNREHKRNIANTPIYRITKKDKNTLILCNFLIIDHLNQAYEDIEFQLIGPEQTIISIEPNRKPPSIMLTACVWIILFIGAAMTIMNFHYDVSMQEVQQKLHLILTGEENEFPLWIQIPYSIGLGLGMILFFNQDRK